VADAGTEDTLRGGEVSLFQFISDPDAPSTRGARDLARPEARRASRRAVGGDFAMTSLGETYFRVPGFTLGCPGLRPGSFVTDCCHVGTLGPQEVSRGTQYYDRRLRTKDPGVYRRSRRPTSCHDLAEAAPVYLRAVSFVLGPTSCGPLVSFSHGYWLGEVQVTSLEQRHP
jgi:hypothetical protein